MAALIEIGGYIANQLALSSALPSRKLPFDERWAQAESGLSVNQQAVFVKREISGLAQKPEVAVTKRMIEVSFLPQEVKDFLLNPPEREGLSWRWDLRADAKIRESDKRSNMPISVYGVRVYMHDDMYSSHTLAAQCYREGGLLSTNIHAWSSFDIIAGDPWRKDSSKSYRYELWRLVQERGKFSLMGKLVRFIDEAYRSRDAVERLLLSCREKQSQDGKTVFLELPFQGNKAQFQIGDGHDIDPEVWGDKKSSPQHASPSSVACVVKFPTSTGPNIHLANQFKEKKMIPFHIGYQSLGSRSLTSDIQSNSVIVFTDQTAELVEEKAAGVSIAPASLQFLEFLTGVVSRARVYEVINRA